MRKTTLVAALAAFVLLAGCGKDPITGTWEGTIYFGQDESPFKLELTNKNGTVTGKVTADSFGWSNANITSGTYVEDLLKELTIVANVGGQDGELTLNGLYSTSTGPRVAGGASTTLPRSGTFVVTK